jgi:hypothetical protein
MSKSVVAVVVHDSCQQDSRAEISRCPQLPATRQAPQTISADREMEDTLDFRIGYTPNNRSSRFSDNDERHLWQIASLASSHVLQDTRLRPGLFCDAKPASRTVAMVRNLLRLGQTQFGAGLSRIETAHSSARVSDPAETADLRSPRPVLLPARRIRQYDQPCVRTTRGSV